jgi:hypothetical protein
VTITLAHTVPGMKTAMWWSGVVQDPRSRTKSRPRQTVADLLVSLGPDPIALRRPYFTTT